PAMVRCGLGARTLLGIELQNRTPRRTPGPLGALVCRVAALPGCDVRPGARRLASRHPPLPRPCQEFPHPLATHHQANWANALAQAISQPPRGPRDGAGGRLSDPYGMRLDR